MASRISVMLDDEHATKLARLAERIQTQPEVLARSLLTTALDEADPDPDHIAAILDGIPDMRERLGRAREQVERGEMIDLDEL